MTALMDLISVPMVMIMVITSDLSLAQCRSKSGYLRQTLLVERSQASHDIATFIPHVPPVRMVCVLASTREKKTFDPLRVHNSYHTN